MKTKEQQAEQYALKQIEVFHRTSLGLLPEMREMLIDSYKQDFLTIYDAAVKDNAELIGKIRGLCFAMDADTERR